MSAPSPHYRRRVAPSGAPGLMAPTTCRNRPRSRPASTNSMPSSDVDRRLEADDLAATNYVAEATAPVALGAVWQRPLRTARGRPGSPPRCRRGCAGRAPVIQQAFSALDRLEVRIDSAASTSSCTTTASISPTWAGEDPRGKTPHSSRLGTGRRQRARSCRRPRDRRVGDNTRLRAAGGISSCGAVGASDLRTSVLGHAVGERRHHLRAQRPSDQQRRARVDGWRAVPLSRFNGDVDNHADLPSIGCGSTPDHDRCEGDSSPSAVTLPPATTRSSSAARLRADGSVATRR
jgi:hypothetical protein